MKKYIITFCEPEVVVLQSRKVVDKEVLLQYIEEEDISSLEDANMLEDDGCLSSDMLESYLVEYGSCDITLSTPDDDTYSIKDDLEEGDNFLGNFEEHAAELLQIASDEDVSYLAYVGRLNGVDVSFSIELEDGEDFDLGKLQINQADTDWIAGEGFTIGYILYDGRKIYPDEEIGDEVCYNNNQVFIVRGRELEPLYGDE